MHGGEIVKLGAIQSAKEIKNKTFSATENVQAFIDNIEKSKLNAFITKTYDLAIQKAKDIDNGKIKGKLAGVVFGVKDVFCTKGIRTTCASKILENFVPKYSATVWEKLENEG